jgi:uncharacterized protein (TIGR02588 family)
MKKNSWSRSPAEKVSFIISLSIITIVIALVCFAWITGDTNPPVLSVTTAQIRKINQQYYVPFTVTNYGGETAESVEVVAELFFDEEVIQTGNQQIDFLSRKEQRSGEFIFDRDPQQGDLKIRVASYKLP